MQEQHCADASIVDEPLVDNVVDDNSTYTQPQESQSSSDSRVIYYKSPHYCTVVYNVDDLFARLYARTIECPQVLEIGNDNNLDVLWYALPTHEIILINVKLTDDQMETVRGTGFTIINVVTQDSAYEKLELPFSNAMCARVLLGKLISYSQGGNDGLHFMQGIKLGDTSDKALNELISHRGIWMLDDICLMGKLIERYVTKFSTIQSEDWINVIIEDLKGFGLTRIDKE